jgi:hypothetical protein
MTPRQTMRGLIARRGYTMVPGAYDTLTAGSSSRPVRRGLPTGGGYRGPTAIPIWIADLN